MVEHIVLYEILSYVIIFLKCFKQTSAGKPYWFPLELLYMCIKALISYGHKWVEFDENAVNIFLPFPSTLGCNKQIFGNARHLKLCFLNVKLFRGYFHSFIKCNY